MNSMAAYSLFLLSFIGKTSSQSYSDLQPGINPVPDLAGNFSKKPEHWIHATPLLQNPKIPAVPTLLKGRAQSQIGRLWNGWANVSYLFSFGDSYTSTNFTISEAQPSPSNPLGNPDYPGATSSDGPNYIDFLTSTYNRSYIQTYNFGYGGATVNDSVVESGFGSPVQSFVNQVEDEFQPTYGDRTHVRWTSSNSLFSIFFGINDVTNSWALGDDSLNYGVIQSYENLVNELYAAGARNFLFLNVPPIDRSPGTLEQGRSAQATEAGDIGRFNFRLGALVYNLGLRHRDTTSFLFDTNFLFTRVLNDHAQFMETAGFKNTTSFCQAYAGGTPNMTYFDPACGVAVNQYFWLNTLHPTYPMHNFMASQIVQLLETVS